MSLECRGNHMWISCKDDRDGIIDDSDDDLLDLIEEHHNNHVEKVEQKRNPLISLSLNKDGRESAIAGINDRQSPDKKSLTVHEDIANTRVQACTLNSHDNPKNECEPAKQFYDLLLERLEQHRMNCYTDVLTEEEITEIYKECRTLK